MYYQHVLSDYTRQSPSIYSEPAFQTPMCTQHVVVWLASPLYKGQAKFIIMIGA
jgi:hypothetical protein